MATILKKSSSATIQASIGNNDQAHLVPIGNEAQLCEIFIRSMETIPGWTCYPEIGGFDILVVHDDGRQIGVEAKMKLNAKVIEQILPSESEEYAGRPGPDHRLVIVAGIPPSSEGLRVILKRLGILVLVPQDRRIYGGQEHYFFLERLFNRERGGAETYGELHLFDWWPPTRCHVPAVVPQVKAGVSSPLRLTPWKEKALRMIALMRRQGFITVQQMAQHGLHSTCWTQPHNGKPAWLAKGNARGQWIETGHMPAFDAQHPDMYALAVAELAASEQPAAPQNALVIPASAISSPGCAQRTLF